MIRSMRSARRRSSGVKGIALRGGQFALGDPLGIASERDFVLNVTLGEAPDRGGAESNEDVARIRRVALEVPMQRALRSGPHHRVGRQGVMVEADPAITRFGESLGDGFGLRMPGRTVREPAFVDLALVLLEGGHMGIAEHRKAVGPKREALLDGPDARGDGLVRKSVDQIDVEALHARRAQALHGACGLLEGLDPVDGRLDDGIEALDAQAHPVDAHIALKAAAIPGVSVRGSISTAISASGSIANRSLSRATRFRKSAGSMTVGVPPPKWT